MPEGKVKWFNLRKGYGFIIRDDGEEIFFHKSNIKYTGIRNTLYENQKVSFEVENSPKGQKAINIKVIE